VLLNNPFVDLGWESPRLIIGQRAEAVAAQTRSSLLRIQREGLARSPAVCSPSGARIVLVAARDDCRREPRMGPMLP